MGYKKETIKGVSWMGGLRVGIRAFTFIKIILLARFLAPKDIGLFGIATLILALLEILTETGINVFLIQEEEMIEKYLNTAWVVSIFRGIIISAFLIMASPLIASFFHSPEALIFIVLISIIPLIRGFINPAEVKFQKDLRFHKEFIFRLIIYIVDTVTAVSVAYITHSAIALILGMLVGVIVEIIISFLFIKPTPKFRLEKGQVTHVISRGKWITAAGLFEYLFQNFDNIVVGRLMGASSLGLYEMAYNFSSIPVTEISDTVTKVSFPVFSKIKNDKKRLEKAFVQITFLISAIVIPIGIILFFFARPIVLIVLGAKWAGSVEAIRVLSIYGVIRAISGSSSALFLAVKKQEYVTAVTLISILGLGLPIVPMVQRFGLVGAGYSVIIGSTVAVPVVIYCLIKVFKNASS